MLTGTRRIGMVVAVAALLASTTLAISQRRPGGRPRRGRPPGQSSATTRIGQQATDFELPVLIERNDAKGQKIAVVTTDKVKLSSYRDKKIVCVFMSSYT